LPPFWLSFAGVVSVVVFGLVHGSVHISILVQDKKSIYRSKTARSTIAYHENLYLHLVERSYFERG
jgi:hypothetical protein